MRYAIAAPPRWDPPPGGLRPSNSPERYHPNERTTMPTGADLLGEFEEHSPAGIRALLAAGVNPTEPINGKRPIDVLIEMYLRSTRFAECADSRQAANRCVDRDVP